MKAPKNFDFFRLTISLVDYCGDEGAMQCVLWQEQAVQLSLLSVCEVNASLILCMRLTILRQNLNRSMLNIDFHMCCSCEHHNLFTSNVILHQLMLHLRPALKPVSGMQMPAGPQAAQYNAVCSIS